MLDKLKVSSGLPNKENKIFKKLIKYYEQKNYKKALKCSEQILSNENLQHHGETLSIQSLMLYLTGKKEESVKKIKLALKTNFNSSICWNTYGLIHKYLKSYDEAIKCFSKASLFDPSNVNIVSELGSLQLQQRDYNNAQNTRLQLLKLKIGQKQAWLAYIVALDLANHHSKAIEIMKAFVSTIDQDSPKTPSSCTIQYSNLLLYNIRLLLSQGKYQEALEILNIKGEYILDPFQLHQLTFNIAFKNGFRSKAIQSAISLLNLNPDNDSYYDQLFSSLHVSTQEVQIKILKYLSNKFPNSFCLKRRLLQLIDEPEFSFLFLDMLRESIIKKQPNFFQSVQEIIIDHTKAIQVLKIVEDLESEYKVDYLLLLWIHYFLSQYHHFFNNHTKALLYIDKCISYSPSFSDGYIYKANILNSIGDIKSSLDALSFAYSLDTADRYTNSIYIMALIKHQRLEKAMSLMKKYQFKNESALTYMKNVECIWLIERIAKMCLLRRDFKRALSLSCIVEEFFMNFINDPLDFHLYCMRKVCLLSYVEMSEHMLHIKNNKLFFKVCRTAVRSCLSMIYIKTDQSKIDDPVNIITDDIQISSRDPQSAIISFLNPLIHFDKQIKNYFLAFDYYFDHQKILLLTKAFIQIYQMEPSHPRTIYNHIRYISQINSIPQDEFTSSVLNNFRYLCENVDIVYLSKSFPADHILTKFYQYLVKVHLGEITEILDEALFNLFNESISLCLDWKACYGCYKEFINNSYVISQNSLIRKLAEKMQQLFPNCCILNDDSSSNIEQVLL